MAMSKVQKYFIILFNIIAAIGAINWGLFLHGKNLVPTLFPGKPKVMNIAYYTIAAAGVLTLVFSLKWAFSRSERFRRQDKKCVCKNGVCKCQ